ncbi:hypothetical protein DY000_02024316 [Brassica cretica]|uniref:Transposase MuDR plant domain-containing protein n=1 Tax=Brassica cretica TaxID=69181 RepID=A0ABQ7EJ19_BRACR|nr:hypothetical protein DY000_02024316 [Brassica cretica]
MVLIYVKSGEWVSSCSEESSFVVDKARRGRMVTLETTTPLEKLKRIVCEDYGVDHNDSSTTLCVTFSGLGVNQKERVNIDLNKEPCDSSNVEDEEVPEINRADFVKPSKESCDRRKDHVAADGSGDVGLRSENNGDSEKDGRAWRGDFVKKDQIFRSKGVLKATMEILAMKNNFDYTVFKSTRKWWYIRCKDALCNWTVRAEDEPKLVQFVSHQLPTQEAMYHSRGEPKTILMQLKNLRKNRIFLHNFQLLWHPLSELSHNVVNPAVVIDLSHLGLLALLKNPL